jgi:hypothetical protein
MVLWEPKAPVPIKFSCDVTAGLAVHALHRCCQRHGESRSLALQLPHLRSLGILLAPSNSREHQTQLAKALMLLGSNKPYRLYGMRHALYRRPALCSELAEKRGYHSILLVARGGAVVGVLTFSVWLHTSSLVGEIHMLRVSQPRKRLGSLLMAALESIIAQEATSRVVSPVIITRALDDPAAVTHFFEQEGFTSGARAQELLSQLYTQAQTDFFQECGIDVSSQAARAEACGAREQLWASATVARDQDQLASEDFTWCVPSMLAHAWHDHVRVGCAPSFHMIPHALF